MIVIKLTITYIDDKKEVIMCCDTPLVRDEEITIYTIKDPMSRRTIALQRISEYSYFYVCTECKQEHGLRILQVSKTGFKKKT